MANGFLFPGGILSLPREAAERLLAKGNGDAALLYLCLLSRQDSSSLHWTAERLQAAYDILQTCKLIDPAEAVAPAPPSKPEPVDLPSYTTQDITMALKQSREFPVLLDEMQRRLGKQLSENDLKLLYTVYDYLGFPVEVILLLTTWCMEQIAEKYGAGRKPTLPQIKKEAFQWHRKGIDTLEAAEAYLAERVARNERAARLLPLVGVQGRAPVDAERTYLANWAEMGFDDDAIRLAYEKTVLKKQSMNWSYMNSILKSWHQQNLHSKASILEVEQGRWKKPGAPAASAPNSPAHQNRVRQDLEWMDRFLEQTNGDKGG